MHQHIHIPMITVLMVSSFTAAVIFISIRAYLDATKCLHWHEKRHRTQPWIITPPSPTLFQRIMNSILKIKKSNPY